MDLHAGMKKTAERGRQEYYIYTKNIGTDYPKDLYTINNNSNVIGDIMNQTQCMIKELEKMVEEEIKEIFIYYAEDMSKITNNMWSIDVMCNRINNACGPMSWTWTVSSVEEEKGYQEEYNDDSLPADYEIIVDEQFSDDVVCIAIQTWLSKNGLGNYGFDVIMIDFKEAAPYSGYVKYLMNRDLDAELETAEPLFMD